MNCVDSSVEEDLADFEAGKIEPDRFPHREHLRLGFEMLGRHSFGETLDRFSRGLKLLAANAGSPDLYHETRTVAFLALIAARRAGAVGIRLEQFIAANPDLGDKGCLERWYDARELETEVARRVFVLPERGMARPA